MPSNIEHANISALKLGTATVTKGYIGHEEVYPNTRELQSAAFTNTSLANTATSNTFRVTGETGSTYDLSGNLTGSYVLSSSPYDHTQTFETNYRCARSADTYTVTLTPTGGTTLQGGGSTFSSSATHAAGPSDTIVQPTCNISYTTIDNITTTSNGVLMWNYGAKVRITFHWTYSGNYYVGNGTYDGEFSAGACCSFSNATLISLTGGTATSTGSINRFAPSSPSSGINMTAAIDYTLSQGYTGFVRGSSQAYYSYLQPSTGCYDVNFTGSGGGIQVGANYYP
jgi:hypothetical protein